MSLFKQFAMDPQKEADGVRITYGNNDDGTEIVFIVRRRDESNQSYVKHLERETKPYRRLLQLDTLDPVIQKRIVRRVFCSSVLVGWENVQDDNNQNIAFSFENAMTLFEKLPDLFYDLAEQSTKLSLFRLEERASEAKN